MIRGTLQWLGERLGHTDSADGGDSDGSNGSRFVPSVLDASVRYAHGGSRTGLESEIAQMEEKARVLDDQRRDP
ncbi:hypothetical protein SAMN05216388_102362 [Halorientalis persicus]|jgi:hypothetical protein|uniref:Uncharacterized protein n=1 Tax=Halorientalis persicus TaxID=1367881 RepID=A0A1H8TQG7_9EURY|nr:hypothetical protein [Halorientalis persicus]SEO93111.1 hypothetical protein SAMN05216388_102362 [Halorientalis persicus]